MRKLYMVMLAGLFLSVTACEEENKFAITPSLGFLTTDGSVAQERDIDVYLYSNVKLESPVEVKVQVSTLSKLEYGVEYGTSPEAVDGIITVTTDEETGEGMFRVSAFKTGALQAKDLSFKIISISGGDVQPAQAVALNYALTIKGFGDDEPTDLTFDFNTGIVGFTERLAGNNGLTGPIWATLANLGFGSTNCVEANGYSRTGTGESNTYLVINEPLFADNYTFSAQVWSQFMGLGTIKFKYSTNYSGNGDPEAAGVTWTEVTYTTPVPTNGNRAWVNVSGKITRSSSDKIYVAIQYVGAKNGNASSWRVDDIKITNQ